MRRWVRLALCVALAGVLLGYSSSSAATLEPHVFGSSPASMAPSTPPVDTFTPMVASTLAPATAPVLGTDGKYHVVYELVLTNAKGLPATLQKVEVLDGDNSSRVIITFDGDSILRRLFTLAPTPATNADIEPNGSRLFFIELAFDSRAQVPRSLLHHLYLLGAAGPAAKTATPMDYTAAPLPLDRLRTPVIGPPLKGDGWVAINGCCAPELVHRGSVQTVNGSLFDAQRFAIDWMRLDAQGRFVHGDASDVRNYTDYGADVIAVADGTVIDTLNTLDDQVPGKLPDPNSITLQTVDGNHVVLDLGGGFYAFYAHMRKGSVTVKPGDKVKRGQVIGKLGNSGNTSAPHLHFHIVTGPSVLGSDGVPYVIDRFAMAGQVSVSQFNAAPDVTGVWDQNRLNPPSARTGQFPLNLNIINFPT
ncbi:M23 family metallopeptidase [Nitrolancea hollandica]|uniref:Peptidase M23 n=1 Tax=Nitrolancea hollandica Lb TaxID=1129897 RepID=I4EIL1_9BACT|nr:M23 family metallopeptidase [Nitrolancea hollandica]CCF84523.1 Peptidase M23 [Nitrolancea hollandica Lb]